MVLSRSSKRALALLLLRKNRKRRAKYWVHPLNTRRVECGEYHRLCQELETYPERYFQYFRMSLHHFNKLHNLLANEIIKENTNYRQAIGTRERLVVTLRFLSTGMSFRSIAFSFRLGEATVNKIVQKTCMAIKNTIMQLYIPKVTKEKWIEIYTDFYNKWNFPNCLGAVDGKHIHMFAPKSSGSAFFNYKGRFSIVLMVLADANYKYIMIDVGSYGGNSDGGVFANCAFGKSWLSNNKNLDLPENQKLPSTDISLPFVLVADEAFPLKENIVRPFPGKNLSEREKIFNYRLSRARRVVENAFGITAHCWRILLKRLEVNVECATIITVACCTLHNYLLTENMNNQNTCSSSTAQYIITQRNDNNKTKRQYARPNKQALDVRNSYADWFMSKAGEVPWQYEAIKHKTTPIYSNKLLVFEY